MPHDSRALDVLRSIQNVGDLGQLIVTFGTHAGETLGQIAQSDADYLRRLATTAQRAGVRAPRRPNWLTRCHRVRRPMACSRRRARTAGRGRDRTASEQVTSDRMLPPCGAWQRLRDIQEVVARQPAIAHAVQCLPLCDQLELTLELLKQNGWPELETPEPLPGTRASWHLRPGNRRARQPTVAYRQSSR